MIRIGDRLSRAVRRLARSAADVLFPPRCVRCAVDLAASWPILLCTECAEQLTASGEASCRRCGAWRAASRGDASSCGECQSARLEFDAVMSLGPYRGALREAILEMKRPQGEPLSAAVAGLLAARRGEQIRSFEPDGIVPVPMFWRRRMWRGTNSAELLATEIGRILNIPVVPGLVVRTRNTIPQKDLSSRQRFQNVRGAFRIGKGYGLGEARIVVVDDVLTTGATCGEVAKTLKKAGAAGVAVVVAGRAGQD
ncbi:MAG: ComF family protein [Pirellulaceae bacterium]|nr:ComF family protein [Thermoguttaceae bacterium]NLZ01850.1 ComF family protein [Pirellulaceae bacterium]